jgi:hypothetical protein
MGYLSNFDFFFAHHEIFLFWQSRFPSAISFIVLYSTFCSINLAGFNECNSVQHP